ncbi:MAG: AarF/ABC1/UbiB kinase family protein [Myxococcota bacterium]
MEEEEVRAPASRRVPRGLEVVVGFGAFFLPTLFFEAVARLPFPSDEQRAQLLTRGPRRLAGFLQARGGPFVKFGQLLSMRYDVLPRRYCRALETLYDRVPPFPAQQARQIIETELNQPIGALFEAFEDTPLAAASFGQIHRVVIGQGPDTGRRAVIKVQRPGAAKDFDRDARWLLILGALVDASRVLGQLKLRPVFRDFVRWTRRETDFTLEAKNADRVYEETEWNDQQRIPYIYWAFTGRRVVTMEYLDGISVAEVIRRLERGDSTIDEDLEMMNCDPTDIAAQILQNHFLQSFVGEVFHGDPHPGNLIVMPDNVIGYVDFGLMGRMHPEDLREQLALFDAVVARDIERLFVAVLDLLDAPRGLLVTDFFETFSDAADAWLDASDNPGAAFDEKSVTNLVIATMDLARAIGLTLSMNTILYFKALMSVDASALRLVPDLDYHAEIAQSLRVVRLRQIEKLTQPGQALDRALNTTLFVLRLPDLIKEQVILYQQTTRSIYRRFNRLPRIAAGLIRTACWALLALALVSLGIDWGWITIDFREGGTLNTFLHRTHLDFIEGAIRWLVNGWFVAIIAAFLGFWVARIVESYSLVKVQRER